MKAILIFLLFTNTVFGTHTEGTNDIVALDMLFVMASSALVLLMTPALGLFIGSLNHLFLSNIDSIHGSIPENLFAFFQMLFAVIGAAIITGSVVERMRFGVLLIFILCWSTLVYDVLAHWVWGGGWLVAIGSLDFAGGGVVHIAAGVAGLVGCLMLGKRTFHQGLLPHSLPLSFIGAILLWLGWLGFNSGSALRVDSRLYHGHCRWACSYHTCSWVCYPICGYHHWLSRFAHLLFCHQFFEVKIWL